MTDSCIRAWGNHATVAVDNDCGGFGCVDADPAVTRHIVRLHARLARHSHKIPVRCRAARTLLNILPFRERVIHLAVRKYGSVA